MSTPPTAGGPPKGVGAPPTPAGVGPPAPSSVVAQVAAPSQMKPVNLSTTPAVVAKAVTSAPAPGTIVISAPAGSSAPPSAASAIRIPKVVAPPTAATIVKTKPLTIPQPAKTTLQIPQPGGASVAAAAVAAAASHRLPATAATFAPLRAQTPLSKPPVSLAVLQQGVPEGAKLTVVHAPSPTSVGGATTIRPLNPVTIRAPLIKSPTAGAGTVVTSTSAPVQFVPLPPGMRVASPGSMGIRQQSATTVQFKPQDPQAAAAVAAAAAASSVRVTLIQSSTSLTKNITTTSGASYFKPVTITTQPRAQLNQPQIVGAAPSQHVRIGLNPASKMTVIPSVPFQQGQQVNVTLNPVAVTGGAGGAGNPVPLSATPARILTAAAAAPSATSATSTVGATRLISVPISSSVQSLGGGVVGSTVSIQKASVAGPATTVTTLPVAAAGAGAKTISLPPYIPKSGTTNLPVARVIPQPLAASESAAPSTSLFIARPPQLQITTSDGGPPVVLSGGAAGAANVIRPGLTIQTASSAAAAAVAAAAAGGVVATPTSVGGSPSRPGILRRRDGERSGIDPQSGEKTYNFNLIDADSNPHFRFAIANCRCSFISSPANCHRI